MACRFTVDADQLSRSTSPTSGTAWTMMGWFYLTVDRNAFTTFFNRDDGAGGGYLYVGTNSTGTTLMLDANGTSGTGTNLATGAWRHLAYVRSSATAHTLYLDGVSDITLSVNQGNGTGRLFVAEDGSAAFLNGRAFAIKVWDAAALTLAEVLQEMRQIMPVRTNGLWLFSPLISVGDAATDYSGNARNWTVGGTLTDEAPPSIPWKQGRQQIILPAAAAVAAVPQGWHAPFSIPRDDIEIVEY